MRKCPGGVSERPSKAINVHGLKILIKNLQTLLTNTRTRVQSFDSLKPNVIELNVTNLEIARLCGSLSKKNIILWITLPKIVEKIKVTKLTYFPQRGFIISSNPL